MPYRALALLIALHTRATLRRSVRGARTLRGALFLGLALIVLALWLGPSIASAFLVGRTDPAKTLAVFPLLLLGMFVSNLVSSAGERAVAFSPAEVDLLFAAPFTRRQLLLYKLARGAVAAVSAALLFSLLFLGYTTFWLAGFVGLFLSLLLLQLLGMTVVLVGQTIGQRARARGRRVALVVAIVLLAAAAIPLVKQPDASLFGVARELRETRAARVILAPFTVFAHVVTARSIWPDMARWTGAALSILGLLLSVVMWLDAHYLEVSAAAGQRLYDRVQRMRRTGGPVLRTTGGARLRVPMPPRFGGAGPIAWRQLTAALRQSRSLLILLLLVSLAAGPAFYAGGFQETGAGALVGLAFWLTIMLANTLRFDFRGDVDHIDVLKSLPVAPLAVVVAQLAAPVVVMTALQVALLAGLWLILDVPTLYVLGAVLLMVPFNVLLFAIENVIFLLFPARHAAGPGDLQGFGRQMVVFLLKMMVLLVAAAIASGAALLVYRATGSIAATLAIATLLLWIEAIAMLPAATAAYLRYDPSMDTPV